MQTDSKDLAAFIKTFSQEIEFTLSERLVDIIDNINYSFQNKF